MKTIPVPILFTFGALFVTAIATTQLTSPVALPGGAPPYPSASVVLALNWDVGSRTVLRSVDDPNAIARFFRKAMVYRGWEVLSGTRFDGGADVIFGKKGQHLQLTAQQAGDRETRIVVNLLN